MNNPNSFEEFDGQDVQTNPDTESQRTEQAETVTPAIDYETKFRESAKEAQRLYAEKKALEKALEQQQSYQPQTQEFNNQTNDDFFPGFNELDDDARNNLLAYTEAVKKKTLESVYKDPAIAFARQSYNEKKWETAFAEASRTIPELASHAETFKAQYYNPNNVPDNMAEVIKDLAKIFLFDKAKDIGAEEEREKSKRINLEDVTGGDKNPPTASRSMEEWQRMASEDPTKFASLSKEFNADLARK
jgi:hypothetical protein